MGGRGLAGRPCCCCGAPSPPGGAYVYEGGRPRGFCGFMGSDELLELEACGESDVGRCWPVGVCVPGGAGDGLCEELLRFEPTRFLKRVFMEFMRLGEREGWRRRVGCAQGYLRELLRLTTSWALQTSKAVG
jgi:hypothetical protein